jgi:hypothetical protein
MTPAASGQLGNKVKGQGDGARTHFRAPQEGRGSCRRGCPQSDARCRFQLTRPAAVTTAREHETFASEGPLPLWLPSSPFTRRQPLRSRPTSEELRAEKAQTSGDRRNLTCLSLVELLAVAPSG